MSFRIELVRQVENLKMSCEWYESTLAAKIEQIDRQIDSSTLAAIRSVNSGKGETARVWIGEESILLVERKNFIRSDRNTSANDPSFQHIAVIVNDIDVLVGKLHRDGVKTLSSKAQMIPHANKIAGGIKVVYLYDIDGYPIALVEYPQEKGKERWHNKKSNILGIDHSAIVVSSTKDAVDWYESIGMVIDIEDNRSGPELDELTQISDARIEITGLEGSSTYGIELIEHVGSKLTQRQNGRRSQIMLVTGNNKYEGLVTDPTGHCFYFC